MPRRLEFVYRPFLLGGVMQATGNQPPGTLPARGKYMPKDIGRWVRRYGIPFAFNPSFPMRVARRSWLKAGVAYHAALFKAAWDEPANLATRGASRSDRQGESRSRAAPRGRRAPRVTQDRVAVVVGAGDGLGSAVARRFAREGFVACLVRRHGDKLDGAVKEIEAAGGRAHAFGVDARREDEVVALFERIEREVGPIEVAVHNIGANVNFSILEMEARKYMKVWEMACFTGFLTGREAARRMVPRGRGTILFTGATASLRGGSGFAAFAGAKFALRALAQSMARELGPKGVHVAHVVVDGPIDMPWIRQNFPEMVAARPADGLLAPAAIAESYWALHSQPRSAWSFELDVRPWVEKF